MAKRCLSQPSFLSDTRRDCVFKAAYVYYYVMSMVMCAESAVHRAHSTLEMCSAWSIHPVVVALNNVTRKHPERRKYTHCSHQFIVLHGRCRHRRNGLVAQWIRRLPTEQEIPSSSLGKALVFILRYTCLYSTDGHALFLVCQNKKKQKLG